LHDALQLQLAEVVAPTESDAVLNRAPFDTFLSVGGITLRITATDRRLASPAGGSVGAFFTDRGAADVDIVARWGDIPFEPASRVLFDSGGAWQLLQADEEFLFTFHSSIGGPHPYKVARFNRGFTAGEVELYRPHFDEQPNAVAHPLQYPLDELVMIHVLSQGKGVEVHGCGLRDAAGRAYLFVGQSGAGKSTMARLWTSRPGVTLLSDERVVLRTDRERIAVYGTPWHGDAQLASPLSGELAAIFFLNRGATNTMAPAGGLRAAANLLACSFLPFHSPQAVDNTMMAVEQVTRATPCYDLWFVPDVSVVELLMRHMG
jgi:hypothetical protein